MVDCHSGEKSGAGLPGWQEGGCGTQEWGTTAGWSQPELGENQNKVRARDTRIRNGLFLVLLVD